MEKIITLYNSLGLESFKKRVNNLSLETLIKIKKNLDNRYYNSGEETISDLKYDILVEILKKRSDKEIPEIGCKLREDDNCVTLPYHLGSMDKIKKDEVQKLENWKKDNINKNYVVSDKLNGVSCLMIFDDVNNIKIYTRGDGTEGADISYLRDKIPNIPKVKENLAVRGELIINQKVFEEKYSRSYKNSLSFIVGNVNSKTLKEGLSNGDIRFVAYEIINSGKSPEKNLNYLKKLKFEVVNFVVNDINTENLSQILINRKENCVYDIDGLIVHKNTPYENPKSGNPKYAFAFKMILDTAETVVEDVEWNASKWGVLKPRIKIAPVDLSGITINYTTGFNAAFIRDNKINKGSRVLITRSGEIIPYIIEVITKCDTPLLPNQEEINFVWNDTNIDIILTEKDEDNVVKIKSLVHFFTNLSIERINEGVVKKLYDNGYNEIIKILEMKVEDFLKIPTFKEKMAEKIYNSIHTKLKDGSILISDLMCASSIFGMGLGKKKAEALCKGFPNIIRDFNKIKVEDINKLEGFSTKTSEKILENLEKFTEFYNLMTKYIKFNFNEIKEITSEDYKNQYIVFSGYRDKEFEKRITSGGGTIQSSVNKKTTKLFAKGVESEKIKKAKELGIEIVYMYMD